MRCIKIHVAGKVQGVFFRASAKEEADRLGIHGTVCNAPDGGVVIVAEGEDTELDLFVSWCKKGPPRAQVLTFVMEDELPNGYVGFRIIR